MTLEAKKIVVALLSVLFLLSLLVVAWIEGGKQRLVPQPPMELTVESEGCYECHKEKTPGIAAQWADSRHARLGVGCYECHQAKEGEVDGWKHEGRWIATVVTPGDCGRCHAAIQAEFEKSHHAKGGQILGSLDNVLGEIVEGPAATNLGCRQCHGSKIEFAKDPSGQIARGNEGKPLFDTATWPNSGIGRINPDGTLGSCGACHSRHRFAVAMSRRPESCGKCHMGPDHPQAEIYEESKHGIAFAVAVDQGLMSLEGEEWIVGRDYNAAPTCATCHMSATRTQPSTHDPGERISWTLRPEVSKHTEDWERKRERMRDVCSACHTPDWIDAHYRQYDAVVELYNEKFAKPGGRIMAALREAGVLTPTPFDEEIEWTWYFLWHHEGRRMRMGASMMGPDYTQWHGAFEVGHRFYEEFIPQARGLGEGKPQALAVLEEVMGSPEHAWKKGLDPKVREQLSDFYRKKYGQEVR
ncbi:MAG: hydroxylamine oxidoreductase [Planctomycetes bacterium]|nr:hydroxylamine oxidoreductase [Planctomycetota bacterium]